MRKAYKQLFCLSQFAWRTSATNVRSDWSKRPANIQDFSDPHTQLTQVEGNSPGWMLRIRGIFAEYSPLPNWLDMSTRTKRVHFEHSTCNTSVRQRRLFLAKFSTVQGKQSKKKMLQWQQKCSWCWSAVKIITTNLSRELPAKIKFLINRTILQNA